MAQAAAISDESAPKVIGRPFQPGKSGNPTGRPRGIASKARELIHDDPSEMLRIFLDVAQDPEADVRDRLAAVEKFLDRAYGKSATFAPIDGEDPLDLTELAQIRTVVDELAAKRG